MKKTLLVSGLVLSALTLAACSNGKSAASGADAKKAYTEALLSMGNEAKTYNNHDVTVKIDSIVESSDLQKLKKQIEGANIKIKIGVDYQSKVVDFSGSAGADGQNYALSGLTGSKGLYVSSDDLTNLATEAAKANSSLKEYKLFTALLDKKYLLIDQATMQSGLSQAGESTDESWSDLYNAMFKTQSLSSDDVNKQLKDIPDKNFTKSGDDVTMKLSGTGDDLTKLLENSAASSSTGMTKAQIQSMMKSIQENMEIKNMTLTTTTNAKKHTTDEKVSMEMVSKKDKTDIKVAFSITSSASKLDKSLSEPSASDSETVNDLLSGLMGSSDMSNLGTSSDAGANL